MARNLPTGDALPRSVDVPPWPHGFNRDEDERPCVVPAPRGGASFTGTVRAVQADDVILTGELRIRGNVYAVRWQHAIRDAAGSWSMGGYEGDGRTFGPIPCNGWQASRLTSPPLPETYRVPAVAALLAAVEQYVAEAPEHYREQARRGLVERAHLAAQRYNDAAAEAAAKLSALGQALDALAAFEAEGATS